MVKHLSTMRETRVQSLGWEDSLEKEMAIHSSTTAWKIPLTEELGRLVYGVAKNRTRLSDFTFTLKKLNIVTMLKSTVSFITCSDNVLCLLPV